MYLATKTLMKINNPNTIMFEMIIKAIPQPPMPGP
jgi:hypothetical protein